MAGDKVEQLIIEILGDSKQYTKAIKDIQKQNKSGEESFKSFAKAGAAVLTTVGASATALGVKAVKEFQKFETGLTSVAKTTNLTGKDLDDFKQNIISMSEEIPVGTDKLLEIATAAGQLGITGTANLTKFTETIAKLGATTNVQGEEAALSIARILNITGEGIDTVDKFGATLVDLGNNFATSEAEILSMATELSKSTVQFGLSSDEILGMSAAMSSLGVEAESGSTVVGQAFMAMNDAIRKQAGPAFNKLLELTGMTGEVLTSTFQTDAQAVFRSFIEGLGKAGDKGEDLTAALNLMGLSGIRVEKILPTLASRSDIFGDSMERAAGKTKNASALNDEAAKGFSSSANQLEIAQNKIDNLFKEIGETIAPTVVEAITNMADTIRDNKDTIQTLAESFAFVLDKAIDFAGGLTYVGRGLKALVTLDFEAIDALNKEIEAHGKLQQYLRDNNITLAEYNKTQKDSIDSLNKFAAASENAAKIEAEAQAKRTAAYSGTTGIIEKEEKKRTEVLSKEAAVRKQINDDAEKEQIKNIQLHYQKLRQAGLDAQNQRLADQMKSDQDMFDEINKSTDEIAVEYELSKDELVEMDQAKFDQLSLQQQQAYLNEIDLAIQHAQEMGQLEKKAELERYRNQLTGQDKSERYWKTYLENIEKAQEKHGKVMGLIIATQQNANYKTMNEGLSAIATLINSENKEQKELGKAATLIQMGMSTAESAMKAFNGLAWIPYVGWALGGIAAAAVAGYGLTQMNQVRQMKEGGVVPGHGTGDKVPALLEPGELVVPRKLTSEILTDYKKRAMKSGGVVGDDEDTDLQKTFNQIFRVPQVFKQIINGENPDFNISGFGAQAFTGMVPETMDALEDASYEMQRAAAEAVPGGTVLYEAQKATGKTKKQIQDLLQNNSAIDALKSIIGDEGVYNLFGGSSTLDQIESAIQDQADYFFGNLFKDIFGFQDGGVVGMLAPGEGRISQDALKSLSDSLNMSQNVGAMRMSPSMSRSASNQGVQKTVVGVELTMNDNLAEFVNAKIREGDRLNTIRAVR
jgi:TP901 family phage tail tape measure protein